MKNFRPHVAKSYFETYKSYDHMQNWTLADRGRGKGGEGSKIAKKKMLMSLMNGP